MHANSLAIRVGVQELSHARPYLGLIQRIQHVFDLNISFSHDLETWSSNHFMHVMFMLCFHISSLSLYIDIVMGLDFMK